MRQVQVHVTTPSSTGEVNKVVWVDESVKPKPGMTIPFKGDSRVWTILHAYGTVMDDKAGAYSGGRV